jgi:flagellar M-ring protein FliF
MFDRLFALSVRQQILLVAGIVAGLCVAAAIVWYVVLRVPYKPLFTGLRPVDAASILGDLDRKRIAYRLSDGGATILVPADIADRTRLDVMTEDIPLKGTVGFELFDKSDMGLTDFAQRINYQRALQGELERTISALDGVESARVHLSLGEDRIFRDDQVAPKASVTIRMQKGLQLPANAATGIARLVSAAVPNLDAANVVILDESGRVVGGAAPAHADTVAGSALDEERRAVEQYYEAQARLALGRAYPLGGLTVRVSAAEQGTLSASSPASASWTPAGRDFPLAVTVSSTGGLDGGQRDNVRGTVASAVGFDAAKNDSLSFVESAAPVAVARPPVPEALRDTLPAAVPASFDVLEPLATILVFLLLAGIAFVFIWQLRRPRRLTEEQKSALAARFRGLLDREESHAAS